MVTLGAVVVGAVSVAVEVAESPLSDPEPLESSLVAFASVCMQAANDRAAPLTALSTSPRDLSNVSRQKRITIATTSIVQATKPMNVCWFWSAPWSWHWKSPASSALLGASWQHNEFS